MSLAGLVVGQPGQAGVGADVAVGEVLAGTGSAVGHEHGAAGAIADEPGKQAGGAGVPVHAFEDVFVVGSTAAAGAGFGALGLHRCGAAREVEVFDVELEQFFCAGAGFVQHPPQRLLPHVDLAAADEPINRRPRADRSI